MTTYSNGYVVGVIVVGVVGGGYELDELTTNIMGGVPTFPVVCRLPRIGQLWRQICTKNTSYTRKDISDVRERLVK